MSTKKYAVFTMDVEAFTDTECISNANACVDVDLLDGFDEYIQLLDKYSIKSTLFTVGSLAPKIADKLSQAIDNGHRLALHNFNHIAPIEQTIDAFKTEISKAKQKLSKLFNTDVIGFRAPFFSMDDKHLEVLSELGFKYDSSYLGFPKARHTVKLHLNNFEEKLKGIFHKNDFFEFSISKEKVFGKPYPISGGGYIRLCNWNVAKYIIKRHLVKNEYYVFYLHPFELTRQKIPFVKELKLYDKYYIKAGIKNYAKHIEELILMLKKMNYNFITFEELCDELSVNTN